ncbi:MAG: catechol 2,3-dioxygenase, partial [Cycloclasticus sp.]
MAMTGILRPGHVQLRVLDMEEALNHYCENMGLIETDRDDQGRVYLKCWDEHDKFSVV